MSPWRRGHDVQSFLDLAAQTTAEFFGGKTVGVMLIDPQSGEMVSSGGTCRVARAVQDLIDRHREGPTIDALTTGRIVVVDDVADHMDRWPNLGPFCLEHGLRSGAAVPLLDDDDVAIGAVNIGMSRPHAVVDRDLSLMQLSAAVIADNLAQHDRVRAAEEIADQLRGALDSRVVIEQAKGHISRAFGIDAERAYDSMRRYARDRRKPLKEVAQATITATTDEMVACRVEYAAERAQRERDK